MATLPSAQIFAPAAIVTPASALVASNSVLGFPPAAIPPKYDSAVVEYFWVRFAETRREPTIRGVVPSADPTLPIATLVVVSSVSLASTIATPTKTPSPFSALTKDVSVCVAVTMSRSTCLPGAATAPSPRLAKIVIDDFASAELLPPPANAPVPPSCSTSNVEPPEAVRITTAGRMTLPPTVALAVSATVALLSLT